MRDLLKYFPDVQPQDVLIVTSRSITVDQTALDPTNNVERLDLTNESLLRKWNDATDDEQADLVTSNIHIATYNKFISLVHRSNDSGGATLGGLKIIVFDECHTLFTDQFITNIASAKTWIRETLGNHLPVLLIGITATPDAFITLNKEQFHFNVNMVLDKPFYRYKIKKMTITDVYGLLDLYRSGGILGKAMVMCQSKEQCSVLNHYIPNSAIIIGSSNEKNSKADSKGENPFRVPYQPYMNDIRRSLAVSSMIPDHVTYHDYLYNTDVTVRLQTLITTSTLREGFNLVEDSGVKTIVVIASDEMNLFQFDGRCRYDVDQLIVVRAGRSFGAGQMEKYLTKQETWLDQYLAGESDKWIRQFEGILENGLASVSTYGNGILYKNATKQMTELGDRLRLKLFRRRASQYITLPGEEDKVIRDEKDKEALVKIAKQLVLFKGHREDRFTFRTVCSHLKKHGYEVVTIRRRVNYEQKREYIIRLKENNEEDDLRIQLRR